MAQWQIERISRLKGYSIEWIQDGLWIISKRNRLYQIDHINDKPRFIGKVDISLLERVVSKNRWGQRMLRSIFFNVIPLADGSLFISYNKQIGLLKDGKYTQLKGLKRPTRILRQGAAYGKDGNIYWGEYIPNKERQLSIYLYRYVPGNDTIDLIHTFEPKEVRHIHGIYIDPFSDGQLWCLAGDLPIECKMIRTSDHFNTMEIFRQGDESWRAISMLFTPDAFYYATDAQFDQNYIFKIDRQTGERTTITETDGPVYYCKAIGDDLFFGVSAELCPSQKQNKGTLVHVNAKTDEATIIFSAYQDVVRKKKKYKDTPFIATLFMFGAIHFPGGPGMNEETFLSVVALEGYDNQVLKLQKKLENHTENKSQSITNQS